MNRTLIIRLCFIAVFLWLARQGWERLKDDDGMLLVYFIGLGIVIGLLFVIYVLPWFGDAIGTAVFLSGEEIRHDENLKAAAKVAQGDYEGAIAEHEKSITDNPHQTFPISEIANLYARKMHDPQRAIQVLQKHLTDHTWPEDDTAFLRFRIIDIYLETLKDFGGARSLLEKIISDFPNTRHSANAHHKLREIEQAEFKRIAEQRANATGL